MKQSEIEWYQQMERKLDVLQRIGTNTKIQIQFIHQRKLKGLLRLLRERRQYFQELKVINETILLKDNQRDHEIELVRQEKIKKILLLIRAKQQEIIQDNKEALEAAAIEKNNIMADLQRLRSRKRMDTSYNTRWMNFTGRRINRQG